jgi:hypothetical protein
MTSKFSIVSYSTEELRKNIRDILEAVQRLHESGEAHGRLAPECFVRDLTCGDLKIVRFYLLYSYFGSLADISNLTGERKQTAIISVVSPS